MKSLRTVSKLVAAFLLPWILLELGLRLVGYHAPDNRAGVLLFPNFPAFYQPDRELGWALLPDLEWRGRELVQPFSTDPAGHRRTPGPEGPPRVDCVGDSSTFGYGSRDDDTYPAVLARLLDAPVRNLGVPGYTAQSARLLAERTPDPAPVTLVMVGFNDHFPAYRSAEEELWIRRLSYGCFASRVCALLFDLLAQPRSQTRPRLVEYRPSVAPDQFRDDLTRAIRTLRERGSEPILLVYPPILSDEQTRADVAAHWKHPRALVDANVDAHPVYQTITREVGRSENVEVVDFVPPFEAGDNAALHIDWVHPNDEGYRRMATLLVEPVGRAFARSAREGAGRTAPP